LCAPEETKYPTNNASALGVLPHMPVLSSCFTVNIQVSNRDFLSLESTRESMFEPYDTHPTLRTYFHKKHIRQARQHDLTEVHNQHFCNHFVTIVILVTFWKTSGFGGNFHDLSMLLAGETRGSQSCRRQDVTSSKLYRHCSSSEMPNM